MINKWCEIHIQCYQRDLHAGTAYYAHNAALFCSSSIICLTYWAHYYVSVDCILCFRFHIMDIKQVTGAHTITLFLRKDQRFVIKKPLGWMIMN